MHMLTKAKLTL